MPVPQEFIDRALREAYEPPPAGSPQALINLAFQGLKESDQPTYDITPGDMSEQEVGDEYDTPNQGPEHILAAISRPEGVKAFLQSAPESPNVEDRRGQTPQDLIRELMMQHYGPDAEAFGSPSEAMIGEQGGYQSLPGLPVPTEFGFVKKAR